MTCKVVECLNEIEVFEDKRESEQFFLCRNHRQFSKVHATYSRTHEKENDGRKLHVWVTRVFTLRFLFNDMHVCNQRHLSKLKWYYMPKWQNTYISISAFRSHTEKVKLNRLHTKTPFFTDVPFLFKDS